MPDINLDNPYGLNPRQQIFCKQYVQHWNATRAAREAGYEGDDPSLAVMASRMLRNANIQAEIHDIAASKHMGPDQILDELRSMASTELDDFLEFKDGIKTPYLDFKKARDAGVLKNVRKFKLNPDGTVDFELYDRREAMTLLGKAHALWRDRVDVTSNNKEIPTVALSPGLLSTILQGQETPTAASTEPKTTNTEGDSGDTGGML